jgi:LCP family protein required for cell wall assembly
MPTSLSGAPTRLPGALDPRGRGRGGGRLALRLVTLLAAGVAGVVLLVSGTGYSVLLWSDSSMRRVDALSGLTDRPPANATGSTTFLLVGSDNRADMSERDMRRLHVGNRSTAAGRRADTMLLVQVSSRRGSVSAVSLPRDSYVTVPAHTQEDGTRVRAVRTKLNSAYAAGGPGLAVATVERSTGVRVDHYVEVDFLGFESLVDAVGGVDVCAPTRLRDRKAGLRLPAGVSRVDGETGLAFVRARSLDARADLGRVERQQQFLAAMANRVTSKDVLLDPRALVRLLDAVLGAVRVDEGLQREQLVQLGTDLRHVSGADVRFRTVPIADPAAFVPGAGSVALWDRTAARRLFARMRTDAPPAPRPAAGRGPVATVPPQQIRVQVYNGTATSGLGGKVADGLARRGFDLAGPAQNWRETDLRRTVVRYDSRYTESIKTLAAAVPGARTVAVRGLGSTLQVVVGDPDQRTSAVRVPAPAGGATPADPTRTAAGDPCA